MSESRAMDAEDMPARGTLAYVRRVVQDVIDTGEEEGWPLRRESIARMREQVRAEEMQWQRDHRGMSARQTQEAREWRDVENNPAYQAANQTPARAPDIWGEDAGRPGAYLGRNDSEMGPEVYPSLASPEALAALHAWESQDVADEPPAAEEVPQMPGWTPAQRAAYRRLAQQQKERTHEREQGHSYGR